MHSLAPRVADLPSSLSLGRLHLIHILFDHCQELVTTLYQTMEENSTAKQSLLEPWSPRQAAGHDGGCPRQHFTARVQD